MAHILFLVHGSPANVDYLVQTLEGKMKYARLREVKLFDLSVPEEEVPKWIQILKEDVPQGSLIRKLLSPFLRLLGYKPVRDPFPRAFRSPDTWVHIVILGVKKDTRMPDGTENV